MRMRFWPSAACVIGALSGAVNAAPEIQAPSEDNPWYQVNVVIFRQPQHLLQSEQWKTGGEVHTHLPNRMVSLENPLLADGLHDSGDASEEASPAQPQNDPDALLTLAEVAAQKAAISHPVADLPQAFALQQVTDEEFLKALNSLYRSPNYEILYQSTWLQPPLEESEALSVLVQASPVHDGLYELEGTARLHVSRYLHFSGNLWLSKYVQQIEVVKPWWQESNATGSANEDSASAEFSLDLKQPIGFGESAGGNANQLSLSTLEPMGGNLAMGETITRYQSIRTGIMSESRRMRSGELHYLDHPLFGVMVKVIPYVPEETPESQSLRQEGDKIATVQ